jgi:hypothetical protein
VLRDHLQKCICSRPGSVAGNDTFWSIIYLSFFASLFAWGTLGLLTARRRLIGKHADTM